MRLPANLARRLLWRRRVRAARVWCDAERTQAAAHSEAVRRILNQATALPPEHWRVPPR